MDIKEETHLILPSDQTHYTNSTASMFKVKLPHSIRLCSELDWYASCDSIIILMLKKLAFVIIKGYKTILPSKQLCVCVCVSDTVQYCKQKSVTDGIVGKLRGIINRFKIEGVEDVKLNS